jgi:RNA polymerase-binding transcription factor DksA
MTTAHKLTREQLRELETELLSERARLERSISPATDSDASAAIGAARRVPGTAEDSLALTLDARAHARYGAILDALTRLAVGTYGVCARCSSGIPYGRLIVLPEAAHCLTCGSSN